MLCVSQRKKLTAAAATAAETDGGVAQSTTKYLLEKQNRCELFSCVSISMARLGFGQMSSGPMAVTSISFFDVIVSHFPRGMYDVWLIALKTRET